MLCKYIRAKIGVEAEIEHGRLEISAFRVGAWVTYHVDSTQDIKESTVN